MYFREGNSAIQPQILPVDVYHHHNPCDSDLDSYFMSDNVCQLH